MRDTRIPRQAAHRDGGTPILGSGIPWEPEQHVDGMGPATASSPERRLLLAILETAIRDLRYPRTCWNADGIRGEAAEWFCSDDRDWPGSFLAICEALNLSPDWIRRRLWRQTPLRLFRQQRQVVGFGLKITGERYAHGSPRGRPVAQRNAVRL